MRGSVLDAYVQNPLRFAERLGHDSGAKGENTNVREVRKSLFLGACQNVSNILAKIDAFSAVSASNFAKKYATFF